jgi:hypothetical protein
MGIEPNAEAPQAIEYTGFPSLVRVQLRPTSGSLKRPPSLAQWFLAGNACKRELCECSNDGAAAALFRWNMLRLL